MKDGGFTVIGIEARTNNALEITGKGVIPRQWDRFMQEGLLAMIPDRSDSTIIAMYTEYESDKDGEYTFVLGAKVNSVTSVPSGMVVKKVPPARYAIFTSERGAVWKVVPDVWKHIWELPKNVSGGDRAYLADFEIYDERAADPSNSQVDVYVGIRN